VTPPPPGWRCPFHDLPADGQLVDVLTPTKTTTLVYRHPLYWQLPPPAPRGCEFQGRILGWRLSEPTELK
jgi:hypothetical protein